MMGATMMNVPVVATMPMAGMMPVQAQQGGGGVGSGVVGNSNSVSPIQQTAQTGGAVIPNAEGVKTFSIKM
jgi:hypothetical protein